MKYSQLHVTSMVSGEFVSFDAYITDMTQTFASTWNTEDVFGRNDPIAMFQGTKRTISIALDVPSADSETAAKNLSKCAQLASFLYPGYVSNENSYSKSLAAPEEDDEPESNPTLRAVGNNMVSAPLVKVKFANLIDSMIESAGVGKGGLLGYIDSYTFTPIMDAGIFGTTGPLYPRTITISFNLNVLHQTEVGHEQQGDKVVWMSKKLPFS